MSCRDRRDHRRRLRRPRRHRRHWSLSTGTTAPDDRRRRRRAGRARSHAPARRMLDAAPRSSGETLTIAATQSRHRNQHHVRHRRRPDLDAQPAQCGAGGEQSAGQHRHDRCDQHLDHQQRGLVDTSARSPVRNGNRCGLRQVTAGGCLRLRPELAGDPRQPDRAVQQRAGQINTTAQDSSFNGINLLNGDTLNLTFDETGASKLAITGVTPSTMPALVFDPERRAPTSWTATRPTPCCRN